MRTKIKSLLIVSMLFFFLPSAVMANEYPTNAGEKLGSGVTNMFTGVLEIPKTMIVTSRKDGLAYGMTNGFFVGIVHAVGRTLSGVFDVTTFVIPTTSFVQSEYIWNNFDQETTYVSPQSR
jgi:putative exosortase-associated protein (TIGR04073 family)